jgi:3-hydroxypropanoate dehydrogenase
LTNQILDDAVLDRLFRFARSVHAFKPDPVTDSTLRRLYDLLKWGPTAFNSQPARYVFVRSAAAKARLAPARDNAELSTATAFRNGTLQGAYLLIAARALGLAVGPMSGFDSDAVNRQFFPDVRYRTNFLANMGYPDNTAPRPRGPRFEFDDVAEVV